MSMGAGGSEYSVSASANFDTRQFLAGIEALNKGMQSLNENMSRMATSMAANVGRATSAVNTHTQRQTILNSVYNTGSQVMQKRYTGSLKGLQDGLKKVNQEIGNVKVVHDGMITSLNKGQQAWLQTAVKMDMVSKYADNMSTKLLAMGKNIQWTGRQLTVGLTTVIGGAATYAITQFNKMDTAIRQTQAMVGSQFIPGITAAAKTISDQWGIAIGDVITSLGQLQKALGTTPQTTQALGLLAAQLSKIGNVDLTTSTNLIRNIFNLTGGSLDQTTKSVQQLGAISQQTAMNLGDFASVLPQAMPLFRTFNINIAQGASILAAFKQSGLDAGTGLSALRMTLTRITAATSGSSSTLKSLKTQIDAINQTLGPNGPKISFFNAQGQLDAVAGLESLAAVWGRINDRQRASMLQLIGMRGGATAIVPLLNAMGVAAGTVASNAEGAAMSTNDFQKAQQIANMSAKDLANNWNTITTEFLKTPSQQWQALKAQISNLAAQLGQQLMPYALKLIGYVESILKWVNQLSPNTKKWVIELGIAAAALGPIVYMMGQLVTAGGAISKLFTKPFATVFNLIGRQQPIAGLGIQQDLEQRAVQVQQGIRSPSELAKDQMMAMQYSQGKLTKDEFQKYWEQSATTAKMQEDAAVKQEAAADKQIAAAKRQEEKLAKQQSKVRAAQNLPEGLGNVTASGPSIEQDVANAAAAAAVTDSAVKQAESDAVKATVGSAETQNIIRSQIDRINSVMKPGGLVERFGSSPAAMMQGVSSQLQGLADVTGLPIAPIEGLVSRQPGTLGRLGLLQSAFEQTVGVGLPADVAARHAAMLAGERAGTHTEIGGRLASREDQLKYILESIGESYVPAGPGETPTSPYNQAIRRLRSQRQSLIESPGESVALRAESTRQIKALTEAINSIKKLRDMPIAGPESEVYSDVSSGFRTALRRTPLGQQLASFSGGALQMGPRLTENIPALASTLGVGMTDEKASKLWLANFARMSRGSQTKLKAMLAGSTIPMPQDLATLIFAKLFGDLPEAEMNKALESMLGGTLGPDFKNSFNMALQAVRGRLPNMTGEGLEATKAGLLGQLMGAEEQLALPRGSGAPFKDLGNASIVPAESGIRTHIKAMAMHMGLGTRGFTGGEGGTGIPRTLTHATGLGKPVEAMVVQAGEQAAPGFAQKLLHGFKTIFGKGAVKEIEALPQKGAMLPEVKKLGALGGIKGLLGKAGGLAIPNMTAILPESAAGITTLLASAAPLLIAIAAIGGAIALILTHWKEVSKGIGSGIKDLVKGFKGLVEAIVKPFEDAWKSVTGGFDKATQGGKAFSSMWAGIGNVINIVSHILSGILDILKPIVGFIAGQLATAFQFIVHLFELMIDLLTGKWGAAWQAARDIVADVVKGMVTQLVFLTNIILGLIQHMVSLGSHLPLIGSKFKGLANDIKGWQKDLKALPNDLANAIDGGGNKAVDAATKTGTKVGKAVDKAAQATLDANPLNPPSVDFSSFVQGLQSELKNSIDGQKRDILQAFDAYVKRRDQQIENEKSALQLKLKIEQDVNKQEEELAKEAEERQTMSNTTAQFLADRQAAIAQGNFSDAMNAQIKYNDDIAKQQNQLKTDQKAYAQSVYQEQVQTQIDALDKQKQQMDDALTQQKQALSDYLDNITQFMPKSQADANKLRQQMIAALEFSGGDSQAITQADQTAISDAWGNAIQNAIAKVQDSAFWKGAESDLSQIGFTAGQQFKIALALGVGSQSFTITAGNDATGSGGTGSALGGMNVGAGGGKKLRPFHIGGLVGNSFFGALEHSGDVPAVLQPGEFVIQRPTVDKLGANFLAQINTGNFDTSNLMGAVSSGGIPMSHTSKTSLVQNQGDVNIELHVHGGVYQGDNDLQRLADTIQLKLKPMLDRRRGLQQRNFQAYK